MTLSKLAQLANVSVSVVSKAFSGKGEVSKSMREHVFAVAREYGCFQQFYHAPYDKPVIAVIIPEAISGFYIHYIEVLKSLMEQYGFTMLLSISNFDHQLSGELARYYVEHSKVDGLLLLTGIDEIPQSNTTAIVSISRTETFGGRIHFRLDEGLRSCLSYLKQMGHTRIGYVGEPLTESKRDLMLEVVEEMGMETREAWLITSFSRFQEAGQDGMRQILSCEDRPTAVFGAYSYITQGMLECLSQQGMRVPQDISVVSMESVPSPISDTIDVSCVRSCIEEICAASIRLLRERMRTDAPNEPITVDVIPSFHVGESVQKMEA